METCQEAGVKKLTCYHCWRQKWVDSHTVGYGDRDNMMKEAAKHKGEKERDPMIALKVNLGVKRCSQA